MAERAAGGVLGLVCLVAGVVFLAVGPGGAGSVILGIVLAGVGAVFLVRPSLRPSSGGPSARSDSGSEPMVYGGYGSEWRDRDSGRDHDQASGDRGDGQGGGWNGGNGDGGGSDGGGGNGGRNGGGNGGE